MPHNTIAYQHQLLWFLPVSPKDPIELESGHNRFHTVPDKDNSRHHSDLCASKINIPIVRLAPLDDKYNTGVSDVYCRYCSDENGILLPGEKVLIIMTEWFNLTESEARRLADLYMRSMPAWA